MRRSGRYAQLGAVAVLLLASSCSSGDSGGKAWAWGYNGGSINQSQLGDGTGTDSSTPIEVHGGFSFVGITSGGHGDDYDHTCGITSDGTAYCWGHGDHGQLGNGSAGNSATPVKVSGGLQFVQLAAGGEHTCGLTKDSHAYCWGSARSGAIGNGVAYEDGVRRDVLAPAAVGAGLTFKTIAAAGGSEGADWTCGISTSGALYCWGALPAQNQGEAGRTDQTTPVPFAQGTAFVAVSLAQNTGCAIDTKGAGWCWGYGEDGQLGDGAGQSSYDRPVPVAGGLQFTQIATGPQHVCALTAGHDAYCWGRGALGGGSNHQRQPTKVDGGIAFAQVAVSYDFSCGISTSGSAYCWGTDHEGNLGSGGPLGTDGSTEVTLPQLVAGGHKFSKIALGEGHATGIVTGTA